MRIDDIIRYIEYIIITTEFMTILCFMSGSLSGRYVFQEEYISFDKLECANSGLCENSFQYSNIFHWSCVIFV
jgi:hypothetical protein